MAGQNPLAGSFVVLGSRVPKVVGLLVGLTLGASILGAVTFRNGLEWLVEGGVLVPALVLRGQLWRLFTWFFFEGSALGLIFACLGLFWFGRDLSSAWGPVRFLVRYLGLGGLTGAVVTMLSLVSAPLGRAQYVGTWALVTALIVVWASLFPHRDVFVYFVLPLRGRNLIYVTIGGTLLFALMDGALVPYLPHFVSQGLAILYMREPFMETLWLRLRYSLNTRGWRRRASHLRPVNRSSKEEPPKWLH